MNVTENFQIFGYLIFSNELLKMNLDKMTYLAKIKIRNLFQRHSVYTNVNPLGITNSCLKDKLFLDFIISLTSPIARLIISFFMVGNYIEDQEDNFNFIFKIKTQKIVI